MKTQKYRTEPEGDLLRIFATRDFGNIKAGDKGGLIGSEENLSHEGDAWVYKDAQVSGNALVYGDARVAGAALVFEKAKVHGSARIYGAAKVHESANVYGAAHVYKHARILGNAHVYEGAYIQGSAWVYGNAHVHGTAHVAGNAHVHGNVHVSGNVNVSGAALVYGNVQVSGTAVVLGILSEGSWTVSPIFVQGTRHPVSVCSPDKIAIGCQIHRVDDWMFCYEKLGERHGYTPEEIAEYGRILRFVIDRVKEGPL